MAESCTITEETFGTVKKIKWVWVSAVGGAVGAAAVNTTTTDAYSGEIMRLVTIPAVAPNAPTADYDIYILDEDATDILMAGGVNRHTSATEQVNASSLGIVANDKLKLTVAAAGDGKGGTVYLYIR
jgi:hypothetical protein